MIALPAIAFALFFLAVRKRGVETRGAFLAAATFCGASVVLITESLSLARLVSRGGVAMCWLGVCVAGLIAYWSPEAGNTSLKAQTNAVESAEDLDRTTKMLLAASGMILLLVAITGLLAPPSGVDALSYHMSRVSMWINDHNVAFYPTPDYTQLIYGAFAEYSIMHTLLLWGSDRLTSMVQLFSLIGCAVAVSYIVKLLGGSRRATNGRNNHFSNSFSAAAYRAPRW